MSSMTKVVAESGEWTLVYTAAGTVTVYLTNLSTHMGLKVRVGASASISDADDAPADFVEPLKRQAYPLVNGDKLLVQSAGVLSIEATLWS